MRYLRKDALAKLSQAASIVALAAERGLEPRPLHGHAVARCPFCSARALILEPHRFRCESCGEGGNAFGLVCRMDGLRFIDALRRVAEHGGLDFDELLTDRCECSVCTGRRTSTVPLWALTPMPACR